MNFEKFIPLLSALTDEALVAIANKGLLRRAQKDLAQEAPTLVEVADGLTLKIAENQVVLPLSGPTQASCSCPATEVCRHVLVGCLWLRSHLQSQLQSPAADQFAPERPAIHLNYTLEDLIAWAGKPMLRKAADFLTQESVGDIKLADPLVVRFPRANITCRYFAATGLTGMVCSCKARAICLHQVAAMLAQLRQQGTPADLPEIPAAAKTLETPRSQQEILQTTQQLLQETLKIGLLHLTETTQQRFVTLSISAQSTNFVRLALNLRSLGDDIERLLTRQASADEERLFRSLAQTAALCEALQHPENRQRLDLIGQSRRHYQPVGSLALMGMGAYPWQTASGYAGLTLLFWDSQNHQWLTWSEARPNFHSNRFDPHRRYQQPLPWQGEPSAAQASVSHLCLAQAKRNAQGRLSGSAQTHAVILGPTQIAAADLANRYFEDWALLQADLYQHSDLGLKVSDPLDGWVVISPAAWQDPDFDQIDQTLRSPVFDQQGRVLYLEVKHREIDAHRFKMLQTLPVPQDCIWGIVGRPYWQSGKLAFSPISLLCKTSPMVLNLSFPPVSSQSRATPSGQADVHTVAAEFSEASEALFIAADVGLTNDLNTPVHQGLETLITILQALANSGSQQISSAQVTELTRLHRYFQSVGLVCLAAGIEALISAGGNRAAGVLKLRYLCLVGGQVHLNLGDNSYASTLEGGHRHENLSG